MATCPKCGAERPKDALECPQCGIIYARFEQRTAQKQAEQEAARAAMMTTCPACGKEVAKQAPTCPGCGQPIAVMPPQGASTGQTAAVPPAATPEPAETKKTHPAALGCGILLLLLFLVSMFSGGGDKTTTTTPTAKSTSNDKPFVKTRNVPIVIDKDVDIIGCHDINDYWMVEAFKKEGRDAWLEQLRPRLKDGRCGRIASGRGTAIEILPSGVAEIRDSQGVKWYVNDADLKAHWAH